MGEWLSNRYWRLGAAWVMAKAQPGNTVSLISIVLLVTTVVLSLVFADESGPDLFPALPVAAGITLFLTAWLWSSIFRGLRPPAQRALEGLQTNRLILRRPRRRDIGAVVRTMDAVVLQTNGWTDEARRRMIRSIRIGTFGPANAELLIVARDSGEVLGSVSVRHADGKLTSCEVGWWLGPEHRGRGYGTEMLRALLPAVHAAGTPQIRIGTATDNTAVKRVLAKVGARHVETRPHTLPDGTTIDSQWYAYDAADHLAASGGGPTV
jgi:RimJ/RimL family protein N-acetyltransferase